MFFDEIFGDVGVSSYLKLAVADEKEDSDGYHEWHAEDGNVRLKALSEVERKHYEVFERTLKRMEDNTLFDDSVPTAWECCRCGFEARGRSAPTVCPLCFASQGSFYRE